MSLQGRIEELANRHKRLETEISEEQKRPAADEVKLHHLKRKKLKIKDELVTLQPN